MLTVRIDLLSIPFWWDYTKESLAATIHRVRPDLIPTAQGSPIPLHSNQFVKDFGTCIPITDGQLLFSALSRTITVEQDWDEERDPTGW